MKCFKLPCFLHHKWYKISLDLLLTSICWSKHSPGVTAVLSPQCRCLYWQRQNTNTQASSYRSPSAWSTSCWRPSWLLGNAEEHQALNFKMRWLHFNIFIEEISQLIKLEKSILLYFIKSMLKSILHMYFIQKKYLLKCWNVFVVSLQ